MNFGDFDIDFKILEKFVTFVTPYWVNFLKILILRQYHAAAILRQNFSRNSEKRAEFSLKAQNGSKMPQNQNFKKSALYTPRY